MSDVVIGLLATICTTSANLPQIWSIYQSKSAKDVSLLTYAILCMGIILWFTYGVLLRDAILITANMISTVLCCTVLLQKIYYDPSCISNIKIFSEMGLISNSTMASTSNDPSSGPVRINVRRKESNSALV